MTKFDAARKRPGNQAETREGWLRSAAVMLRPLFDAAGLPLPERIRFAIAFPSSGKRGERQGECWHAPASADASYEIIIRADLDDPVDVLGVLVRELVHAALPPEDSHGRKYKAAALRIGLEGRMLRAAPGPLLKERLHGFAAELGPLPHAALDLHWRAVDRPKKQRARMLKAECPGKTVDGVVEPCGYTVRLSSKWAGEYGAICPKHGPMTVQVQAGDDNTAGTLVPAEAA